MFVIELEQIKTFLEEYFSNGFIIENLPRNRGLRLTTPFLFSDNDCIELEIILSCKGKIIVDDTGDTCMYLFLSGLDVKEYSNAKQYIYNVTNDLGLEFKHLLIRGTAKTIEELPQVINNVITAVITVSRLVFIK